MAHVSLMVLTLPLSFVAKFLHKTPNFLLAVGSNRWINARSLQLHLVDLPRLMGWGLLTKIIFVQIGLVRGPTGVEVGRADVSEEQLSVSLHHHLVDVAQQPCRPPIEGLDGGGGGGGGLIHLPLLKRSKEETVTLDLRSGCCVGDMLGLVLLKMALSSALTLASCRAMATRAAHRSSNVVIIGGGAAGLAAALEASNSGASVYLLEKMPKVGGNSAKASSG